RPGRLTEPGSRSCAGLSNAQDHFYNVVVTDAQGRLQRVLARGGRGGPSPLAWSPDRRIRPDGTGEGTLRTDGIAAHRPAWGGPVRASAASGTAGCTAAPAATCSGRGTGCATFVFGGSDEDKAFVDPVDVRSVEKAL